MTDVVLLPIIVVTEMLVTTVRAPPAFNHGAISGANKSDPCFARDMRLADMYPQTEITANTGQSRTDQWKLYFKPKSLTSRRSEDGTWQSNDLPSAIPDDVASINLRGRVHQDAVSCSTPPAMLITYQDNVGEEAVKDIIR